MSLFEFIMAIVVIIIMPDKLIACMWPDCIYTVHRIVIASKCFSRSTSNKSVPL